MRLRRYLAIGTMTVLLCAAATARAQLGQANGLRLGEAMVLHLGLGVETAWDSNIFYAPSNPINAFELRLTPHFDLTNRPRQGERQIQFDFHGGLNYLEYLTSDQRVSKLRQFGVDAGLQAAFFTMSPYNFVIFDNYVRTTQPPYQNGLDRNFDRDTNELGVRINLSPGGGRLTFNVGYLFGIDYFEPPELQPYNLMYHRFDLRASWRFLPKTAVYLAASEILYLYQNASTNHPNSYPLRVEAGLQGLITAKLTVNVWIGYGNGFYGSVSVPTAAGTPPTKVDVNPSTVVAGLALTWKPTTLSSGTLGYNHDFVNSLLGSYYDLDQVYVSWTQLIWRFTGFVRFSYANERFQGIVAPNGPTADVVPARADNYITLNVRLDYPFKDWLWASAGYDLQFNTSNGQLQLGLGPASTVPVDYTKHVVYLRLTAWY
jgi:hypothetical protein